jgi:chemotaxis signal transduction protein
VDSAREVIHLDPDTFRPPPDIVLREAQGYVRQVAQAGARVLLLIDFDKVIGNEEELHGG